MSESNKIGPFNYSYVSSTGDTPKTDNVSKGDSPISDEINVPTKLNEIRELKKRLLIEEGKVLEKGLESDDPDVVMKAQKHWEDVKEKVDSGIKSDIIDPYEFRDSLGFKAKGSGISYNMLRRMAETPLIRAVITTRQAQVSEFAMPQNNKFEAGFIIQKRQKHFSKDVEETTDADRKIMDDIANFILNGGKESNAWNGDTFSTFLKKMVEDSLVLDQGCFEVVRNNFGEPLEYIATDGATFRIADTFNQDSDKNDLDREEVRGYLPKYVQVIDGSVKAEYYPWELCFGIRNATTNIHSNGYGKSELEVLVQTVTWMLYSDQYNGNFFSQGAAPKGFLKVSGNVNKNRMLEFRKQWQSMVAGVMNAWKTPIIESDKMEWIDTQKSNTDMQFQQWQEYLLKVVCSVYKISPDELGFSVSNSGGSSMFEGNNEGKIKYSRDKGLRPLLKNIEFWVNRYIVNALNSDFEFRFVGLDVETEEKSLDLDVKRLGSFMGLKEIRRKNDLPDEIEDGDIILNPIFQQAQAMKQMQGEQEDNNSSPEASSSTWDDIDTDDDGLDFEEESEKGVSTGNPFLDDLNNDLLNGVFDE